MLSAHFRRRYVLTLVEPCGYRRFTSGGDDRAHRINREAPMRYVPFRIGWRFPVVLAACTIAVPTGTPASAAPIPVTVRMVTPSSTGPGISDQFGSHLVALRSDGAHTGRLLVFFVGTRARPDD